MIKKRTIITYAIAVSVYFIGIFCGTIPSDPSSTTGTVDVRVWINKPPKPALPSRETTWDRLVIQITSDDGMDTLRDTFALDMEKSFYSFFIENVSAGENRTVSAWTIDSEGDTIHGIASTVIDIDPAQSVPVTMELHPIKGSLYAVLTGIPLVVDSVLFGFITSTGAWYIKDKKATKLDMTLDKIPFGSSGTLSIVGYNSAGDTVASWAKEGFTFTNANATLEASFINVGKVNLSVTISIPGVTLIVGIMDTTNSLEDEKGGLLISEIMYSANDSEYIELYNPKGTAFNDTIIIQIDNGPYRFFNVSIQPDSFYVIGRDTLPWADTYHSTQSALNLSSTTGNWITLRAKDSTLMDLVVFQPGSNNQGWPGFSGKKSIVLDSLPDDPEYNNYGATWLEAVSYINQTTTLQQGTPGKSGI